MTKTKRCACANKDSIMIIILLHVKSALLDVIIARTSNNAFNVVMDIQLFHNYVELTKVNCK